jgi:hypothetical protein
MHFTVFPNIEMNPDDWRAEGRLPNGGLRVRHLPTRCVFDVWEYGEVHLLLRQGAAGTYLFEEVREWFESFGKRQLRLL